MAVQSENFVIGDIVDALVADGHIPTKRQATEVVNAVFGAISGAANAGQKVRIHNFGTFQVKHKEARFGRNPATGGTLEIPAKDVLVFKATKHA